MKDRDAGFWPLLWFAAMLIAAGFGVWTGGMIGYASAKAGHEPPAGFCVVFECRREP